MNRTEEINEILNDLAEMNQDLAYAIAIQDKIGDDDTAWDFWFTEEVVLRKNIADGEKKLKELEKEYDHYNV